MFVEIFNKYSAKAHIIYIIIVIIPGTLRSSIYMYVMYSSKLLTNNMSIVLIFNTDNTGI